MCHLIVYFFQGFSFMWLFHLWVYKICFLYLFLGVLLVLVSIECVLSFSFVRSFVVWWLGGGLCSRLCRYLCVHLGDVSNFHGGVLEDDEDSLSVV